MAGDDGRAPGLTGAEETPRTVFHAEALLDALRATHQDRAERRVKLTESPDRELDATVNVGPDGQLLIGFHDSALDEGEPLRLLARQMAGENDTQVLLEILCDAGAAQCAGTGAGVLRATPSAGEFLAAVGPLARARGQRLALPGSLAREVLRTRDVVIIDDFTGLTRRRSGVVAALRVGPMLLAPLIAHDVILGVLAVTRDAGAAPFSKRDAHRLRAIADNAALALWKAELLEQAQAADRAKSRFLATMSHELRTPLTALAGYEELLADQVIGPLSDAQIDILERMRAVTHHLGSVIEEVLEFSSLDQGREVVRPTDFLAADLVQAVAAVVEPLARQKELRFATTLPPSPIRVTSDVDKVRKVLINLAGNAVKFTDAGEVRIELSLRQADAVCFTVRDSGIGIAPRDLERLFKPFAQLDAGLTRRHGGTGLGLYISRGLANLLGGAIEVESEVRKGSAFTLTLPLEFRH